jgi:hypothetical protein
LFVVIPTLVSYTLMMLCLDNYLDIVDYLWFLFSYDVFGNAEDERDRGGEWRCGFGVSEGTTLALFP